MSEYSTADASTTTVDRETEQRDLVSRAKAQWQREQTPDAVAFLNSHASMRGNRALILELAYEEYCIRRDNGETLDVATFCDRFPSISRVLHRQIQVDEYIRSHPSIVGEQVAVDWPAPR